MVVTQNHGPGERAAEFKRSDRVDVELVGIARARQALIAVKATASERARTSSARSRACAPRVCAQQVEDAWATTKS